MLLELGMVSTPRALRIQETRVIPALATFFMKKDFLATGSQTPRIKRFQTNNTIHV
jgi:hypothetical protein